MSKANVAPDGGTTYDHANPNYHPSAASVYRERPAEWASTGHSVFDSPERKAIKALAARFGCPLCGGRGEVFGTGVRRQDCECVKR